MRTLDVGVPKVMVSTVASGNVAPYVGPSDICMMYSVTDVAGLHIAVPRHTETERRRYHLVKCVLERAVRSESVSNQMIPANRISRRVLGNAAHAAAGMVTHQAPQVENTKPALGITMFGVTTPCAEAVRKRLEGDYDCLVFHATGTGGQSMEKLMDSGLVAGVIDVTTTEVADLLMGGVMSAGEDRLGAVARTGLPYVGSCGALDMVNFGAKETVPEKYQDRNLYVHNPQVAHHARGERADGALDRREA